MLDATIRKQNTNNVNKTWSLLQTTEGKQRTEHSIYAEIVMNIITRNIKTHNRSTQKKN